MKKFFSVISAVFLFFGLLSVPALHADEPVATAKDLEKINEQLMDQIKNLQNQVRDLSSRVDATERRPAAAPTYVAGTETPREGGVLKTLEDINLSGFLDTSYSYNMNRPQKAGTSAGTNNMRVFDTRDNNFDLNALELDFEKLAPETGGVGFRADLVYGLNATVTDGGGLNFDGVAGVGPDEFDLQQAYGELNIPINGGSLLGDNINLKAGKFVTLAGAEVIESKDNWNISRSIAFGFGIPFAHTGIRSGWTLLDGKVNATLGINNGWDTVQETGNGKTVEMGLTTNLTDNLTFATANYIGPESQTDAVSGAIIDDVRFLTSNVLTWKTPVEKLTLMGNFDFGNQRNVTTITAGSAEPYPFESGQWHSYNLYAKYDLSDKMYLAYRGELFRDDDSFRTFGTTTPRVARKFWGHTFTLDYRPYTNLITRLEYRQDNADASIYDVTGGGSTNGQGSQSTFATQLIYLF
ncbi:MAG: porin [Candidatus Omnitrophica bacterium]|nr:porin [Candidatus Omnitrophota bacterium]